MGLHAGVRALCQRISGQVGLARTPRRWPRTLPDYAPTVPHQAFMLFQMVFAVITPALIIGAVVERIKFSSALLFILLWATIVYDPFGYWLELADGCEAREL
ncbi:MAG: hypothetical protein QXG52_07170 [Candidatus Caldarchaeum sp.]